MKKNAIFLLFYVSTLLLCSDRNLTERLTGVWGNKDCELLRTEKYFYLFTREGDSIIAELREIDKYKNKIIYKPFAKVTLSEKNKTSNIEKFYLEDNTSHLTAEIDNMSIISNEENQTVYEEILKNGDLRIFYNERFITLKLIEKLKVVKPYEMELGCSDNTGKCLQQWSLGTSMQKNDDSVTFLAGTNRHSYILTLSDGFTYCRAARIRSNNKGTVFAQNIRMMKKNSEFTSSMSKNNYKISSSDLKIDDSLFDPKVCIFGENGIYWSLMSAEKNEIKLNGCGGDTYNFSRPSANNGFNEWLEYKRY